MPAKKSKNSKTNKKFSFERSVLSYEDAISESKNFLKKRLKNLQDKLNDSGNITGTCVLST